VTSLMTALISDASYQSKLDEYWKEAVALGDENYFNQSLKLLNGLLVSGNMPNLMTAGSATPSSSSSAVLPVSSSSTTSIAATAGIVVPTLKVHGRTLQANLNGMARVDLFSVTGSLVKTLWNGDSKGSVSVSLKAVPSGLYIAKVSALGATRMYKINVH